MCLREHGNMNRARVLRVDASFAACKVKLAACEAGFEKSVMCDSRSGWRAFFVPAQTDVSNSNKLQKTTNGFTKFSQRVLLQHCV